MQRWLAILVAVLTLSALSGVGAYQLVRPALDRGDAHGHGKWQEIAWPYPKMPDGSDHAAVGIALNHRCDLLVAVVQGRANPSDLKRAAMDYLASHEIHHWMMASLGGR
jgi:hypothetical protein